MAALCLSQAVFVAGPTQLSLRKAVAKPAKVTVRVSAFRSVVAMSTPDLKSSIAKKIEEATETCANPNSTAECAVAWDEVEEISAAAADQKRKAAEPENSDPLEKYCDDNPDADECRVYSD